MTVAFRPTLSIVASLCMPFALQTLLVVTGLRPVPALPEFVYAYSVYISAAAGFAWLVFEFRAYALPFAIVYFPAMVIALTGSSLGLGMWLSHDAL